MKERTAFRALVVIVVFVNLLRASEDMDGSFGSWGSMVTACLFAVYLPPAAWRFTKDSANEGQG